MDQDSACGCTSLEGHTSGLSSALNSEREETKKAKQEAKSLKDGQDALNRKRLEEQGEYKELSKTLTGRVTELEGLLADAQAKASRHDELSAVVDATYEASVAQIPEDKRALLDSLPDSMTSKDKLDYINQNKELFSISMPNEDWGAGKRGSSSNGSKAHGLNAEELQFAKMANMTPEEYAENKDKE